MDKQNIIKLVEKFQVENINEHLNDVENLDSLFYEIEDECRMPFSIIMRGSRDGSDWWLQCEYYSIKLKKVIIWDYDYNNTFKDAEKLADTIIETEADIKRFEDSIVINKTMTKEKTRKNKTRKDKLLEIIEQEESY